MAFNYSPALSSDLLTLRPLTKEDFDALYTVAKDPLIWQQHPANNRHQKEVFEQYFQETIESYSALIVIDNSSNAVIGTSRFHNYNQQKSEIEIGWTFLSRAYWGGVYNRELKRLMFTHAFHSVESVLLIIGIENLRSQKAAEKIGGIMRPEKIITEEAENVVYAITQVNFENSQTL